MLDLSYDMLNQQYQRTARGVPDFLARRWGSWLADYELSSYTLLLLSSIMLKFLYMMKFDPIDVLSFTYSF